MKLFVMIGHLFFMGLILSASSTMSLLIFLEGLAFLGYVSVVWNDFNKYGSFIPILFISSVMPFLLMIWGLMFSSEVFIAMAFLFKMSFFPFLWWFPYMSSFLTFFLFFVFGVVKKVFPMLMLMVKQMISVKVIFFVCEFSILISLLYLVNSQNDLKVFFAWSSKVKYGWIIIMLSQSWLSGIMYFVLYVGVFSFMLFFLKDSNLFFDQFKKSQFQEIVLISVVLVTFLGLPPFFGFFYKYILINSVVGFDYLNVSFFILISLVILMTFKSFIYMKLLFKFNLLKFFFSKKINWVVLVLFISYMLISVEILSI